MSYDLSVWCIEACNLATGMAYGATWKTTNDSAVHQKKNWQIIVNQSVEIDDDLIPDDISAALPGVRYQTEINLEPSAAPEVAKKLLLRIAKGLASSNGGVVYDPEGDCARQVSATKRFSPPKSEGNASALMLSWWCGPDTLKDQNDFLRMLRIFQRYIPETLPRRYGTFEPPEYKFEGDTEALAYFLNSIARKEMVVWYPTRPVIGLSLSLPQVWGGPDRNGFKANRLEIEFDLAVLDQRGWQIQIRRFWRQMSDFLKPFYGDVRHVHGYRRYAGRFWHNRNTEHHPIRSWFWRGIPSSGGVATVIGTPYREAWKEFTNAAENTQELSYLDAVDWGFSQDVFSNFSSIPVDLIDPNRYFEIEKYPKFWPFGEIPNL